MTEARLSLDEIRSLVAPYVGEDQGREPSGLYEQISAYVGVLLRWNSRMNLTSVRDPEELIRRHFGESLLVARHVEASGTLLDLGSGAGFPGLPIQLWHPKLVVTLAESQTKKATFLREVVRCLSLGAEVWQGRAEDLPPGRMFDSVVMRAVDRMEVALVAAKGRARDSIWVMGSEGSLALADARWTVVERVRFPGTESSFLFRLAREFVPRGT